MVRVRNSVDVYYVHANGRQCEHVSPVLQAEG
jgi:hypothetical protein